MNDDGISGDVRESDWPTASVPEWYVSRAEADEAEFPTVFSKVDGVQEDSGSRSTPGPGDGVPAIKAARLASVVESLESNAELLGRIQTFGLDNADRRALLVRVESVQRMLFAYSHTWIADLINEHGLDDIWGSTPEALSVLLRISGARAGQRILLAKEFGERTSLTGERLEPLSANTLRAAEDGVIDEEHQQTIRKFFRRLGDKLDIETRERAEQQLAQLARELGPDHFKAAAARLYDLIDPDGEDESPERVADRCYVRLGEQGPDGLSKGTMVIDAEFRAYLEAVLSKWAKPGQLNSADSPPVVDAPDGDTTLAEDGAGADAGADDGDDGDGEDGVASDTEGPDGSAGPDGLTGAEADSAGSKADTGSSDSTGGGDRRGGEDPGLFEPPAGDAGAGAGAEDGGDEARAAAQSADEDRASKDRRGRGRRQHDAMKMVFRQMLASGQLGQHRGLPVTAVVSMSLKDLESASGHAVTATGSLVKMRDAIRMASHAHHYLVIFDNDGRPLHLGRTKRLASVDQRIVLIAADRGCSFPGCTRPATWSQVHHVNEWVAGGNTDIEDLTFGCDQHHRLVGPSENQWATTKAGSDHQYPGRTLWHAPVTLDPLRRGLVNHFHHPGEYIYPAPEVPLPDLNLPDSNTSVTLQPDTSVTLQPDTLDHSTLDHSTLDHDTARRDLETVAGDSVAGETAAGEAAEHPAA
ncbi:HNH endonuclease signature motif containing protein [Rhodococcoides kyotonense]|uniref:HNH nuclease domain-containing protein n=1 Tax=Rhodococcoides kyotonense TaxID=398843 RepID=A0A239G2N9_9NOCA|nr:HNH endonuclease signature motif containing protein [Rhodococcus kyotonensis]SNS63235.1 protein of unknown function [Rhodococcus kyotonensis]